MIDHIVRKYYACFNERRFAEAVDLLANDVELDYPGTGVTRGREAYLRFTGLWVLAFPDITVAPTSIEDRGDTISEVRLMFSGSHTGRLDLGPAGTFEPLGARVQFEGRELLEIRVQRITFARLTVNVAELRAQASSDPTATT